LGSETSVAVAITARGLADYQLMFRLGEDSLRHNSFLDCGAGASSFGAQVRLRGGSVISVDPAYLEDAEAIRGRVEHNLAGARQWLTQHSSAVNWDHLGSIEDYLRGSELVLDLFIDDFATHPEHYIASALPHLPLPDNAVDIALCANLLFAYCEILTATDVASAILELARIARSQVLIHPICDRSGSRVGYLPMVIDALTEHGLRTEVFTASASWLANSETLRVIA
jgi:hypothetical protein